MAEIFPFYIPIFGRSFPSLNYGPWLIAYMAFIISLEDSVGNLVRKFEALLAYVKLLTRFHVCCLAVILDHARCWRIVHIMEREKIES
jgi:hypothetical protein